MKSAYITIHLGKKPPLQNGCQLKSAFLLKTMVSHPPFTQLNRTFTKPTGCHYTKYRFSPDIDTKLIQLSQSLGYPSRTSYNQEGFFSNYGQACRIEGGCLLRDIEERSVPGIFGA
jgi:hypothetical protein